MFLAETGHSFSRQTAVFAVASARIAPAPATPGALDAVAVATDFLLAGLMAMILATIGATCGIIAIRRQLV